MPDQMRCCIIGVCCVPFSAEQEAALAEYIAEAMAEDGEQATDAMRVRARRAAKKLYADKLIRQAT